MPLDTQPVGMRANTSNQQQDEVGDLRAQLSDQETAVGKAISFRRYQRWLFYGLLIIMFVSAVALIVKIYNDNSKLLASVSSLNVQVERQQNDLSQREEQLNTASSNLSTAQAQLSQKDLTVQEMANKLAEAEKKATEASTDLSAVQANLVNLILELGQKSDSKTLAKIGLADVEPDSSDSDSDGLADTMEIALATDSTKADSDNDGNSDKQELANGYNPLGTGKLALDAKLAKSWQGKVILQEEGEKIFVWYIGFNSKKYFFGALDNGLLDMRKNKYWTR